jgi:hypothetical protein
MTTSRFDYRESGGTLMADTPTKEYIGDGVYVSVRAGWGDLLLETDRDGVTHWIVLEPQAYAALLAYVQRLEDPPTDEPLDGD